MLARFVVSLAVIGFFSIALAGGPGDSLRASGASINGFSQELAAASDASFEWSTSVSTALRDASEGSLEASNTLFTELGNASGVAMRVSREFSIDTYGASQDSVRVTFREVGNASQDASTFSVNLAGDIKEHVLRGGRLFARIVVRSLNATGQFSAQHPIDASLVMSEHSIQIIDNSLEVNVDASIRASLTLPAASYAALVEPGMQSGTTSGTTTGDEIE